MNRKQSGYTLIEILIVLFIISIVTSVALLTIGRNDHRRIEAFANELAQRITLAEEQALLQPTVLGLDFKEQALQFSTFQPAVEKIKAHWEVFTEAGLKAQSIPDDIEISLHMGNQAIDVQHETPPIVISTNGELTPFVFYIGKKGEKPRYKVIGEADGHVSSKQLS